MAKQGHKTCFHKRRALMSFIEVGLPTLFIGGRSLAMNISNTKFAITFINQAVMTRSLPGKIPGSARIGRFDIVNSAERFGENLPLSDISTLTTYERHINNVPAFSHLRLVNAKYLLLIQRRENFGEFFIPFPFLLFFFFLSHGAFTTQTRVTLPDFAFSRFLMGF